MCIYNLFIFCVKTQTQTISLPNVYRYRRTTSCSMLHGCSMPFSMRSERKKHTEKKKKKLCRRQSNAADTPNALKRHSMQLYSINAIVLFSAVSFFSFSCIFFHIFMCVYECVCVFLLNRQPTWSFNWWILETHSVCFELVISGQLLCLEKSVRDWWSMRPFCRWTIPVSTQWEWKFSSFMWLRP